MTPGRSDIRPFTPAPRNHAGGGTENAGNRRPRPNRESERKIMKIEIYSTTGAPLYRGEHENLAAALTAAAFTGADLRGANLARADLANADLSGEDGK